MNKKGFTLIELLAVIVILAIIAVITVPMIMNVIDKAKVGALEDSAYGMIESANLYYAKNIGNMDNYVLFEIQDGKQISEQKLDFKGSIDGNAKVLLTSDGKVALCLTSGKSYVKKEITDTKVTTATASSDTTCTMPNLADNDFTISIEGSSSNYYDKDTIDIKVNDLQTKINTVNNIIGTTNISGIGDGTVTGAINNLNTDLNDMFKVVSYSFSRPAISANSQVTITVSPDNIPAGYKIFDIVSTDNYVYDGVSCVVYISNYDFKIRFTNTSASSSGANISLFTIRYIKI